MNLNGKKILITCGGGLGDMICFTPALRRMKELYPTCQITFMTKYGNHEILEGLSYIDQVIYIRRGKFMGRYRVLPYFVGQDAVVFTDWQPQLLLCSKLLGIPIRAGIPRPGHHLNRYLTRHLQTNVMKSRDYAAETNARLFSEALDVQLDGDMTKLDIAPLTQAVCDRVDEKLQAIGLGAADRFLLLSPFANFEKRNWPIAAAADFVERVESGLGLPVVITGPRDKAAEAGKLSSYNLMGNTTTSELAELIRRAACLVTPDSGPMHVAGAVGTPVAALFSKDLPSRWAPRERCVPITLNFSCSPCNDEAANACPHGNQCMRGITAEMVYEAVRHII